MNAEYVTRLFDLIEGYVFIAQGDVLKHATGEKEYVLQNNAYVAAQIGQGVVADILSIYQDLAVFYFI